MSSNLIPYINKIEILNNCYLFYKILKIILILNLIFILIKINITFWNMLYKYKIKNDYLL